MDHVSGIILEECPVCRGDGMLMHEGGWNVQVECSQCGSHTVYLEYETDAQKAEAEKGVAALWNMGKVISSMRGE